MRSSRLPFNPPWCRTAVGGNDRCWASEVIVAFAPWSRRLAISASDQPDSDSSTLTCVVSEGPSDGQESQPERSFSARGPRKSRRSASSP
eukprot:12891407-Heterocapsa_arctica.AAC.1